MTANRLDWIDHAPDPASWARSLGVSDEAVGLLLDADNIDLHCDLDVPTRVWGYDPARRHQPCRYPPPLWGHTDFPRLREARFSGVCYDIATNPFRSAGARLATTKRNLSRLQANISRYGSELAFARTWADYQAVRASGRTAMFLTLQGGNAISADPDALDGELGRLIHRITLVHLSSSDLGGSNSPSQPDAGITERGRAVIAACNRNRVLVDLAHAGVHTVSGALEAHDQHLPPIISHTGMAALRPMWRNTTDAQARAIAERGGVVGIVFQGNFLRKVPPGWPGHRADIIDHLDHLIGVAGEDAAAIGTDYDGLITPPWDLPDVTGWPLLVQDMLDRGWSEARTRKVLGGNYCRVLKAMEA